MILPRFLLEGIEGQQKSYRRDHFPSDTTVTKYGTVSHFKGKITKVLENDTAKTVHIDDAYKVSTVSDKIRGVNLVIWIDLEKGTKNLFKATLIVGVTGIVSAMVLRAWMIGGISLVILSFSYFSWHRSNQAKEQAKFWLNPIPNYIEQCRQHDMQLKESAAKPINPMLQQLDSLKKQYIDDLKLKVQGLVDQIRRIKNQSSNVSDLAKKIDNRIQNALAKIVELEQQILAYEKAMAIEQDLEKKKLIESHYQKVMKIKEEFIEEKESFIESKKREIARQQQSVQSHINSIVVSISEAIKLFLNLKAISKDEAYHVLEAYFSEIPDLKKVVDDL